MQNKFASAIATKLECSNVVAIQNSIAKLIPVNCKEKEAALRSVAVCSFLVDPVVELVAKAPAEWDCKLTKAKEDLQSVLSNICGVL